MTILVTGVAGFIGYSVARRLLHGGEEVVGIDSLNDYYPVKLKQDRLAELRNLSARFTFQQLDFTDVSALERFAGQHDFDRIVHLGAQAGVRHSIDHPAAYVQANMVGHANILELARKRQVRHMIYASSSSVYGGNARLPFRIEDRVDHPLSLYAASKRADELMSEVYANLYRLPLTGLRFFTVYGPWGRPDMAMWIFTKALLERTPLILYNHGRMRRDFTYIDDIVNGVTASLDWPPRDDASIKSGGSSAPHALYNLGNSRSEELLHLVGLLEQATGRKADIRFEALQPGDAPDTYADVSATTRDLDYAPAVPIEVGVPLFVEWFRSYHGLPQEFA